MEIFKGLVMEGKSEDFCLYTNLLIWCKAVPGFVIINAWLLICTHTIVTDTQDYNEVILTSCNPSKYV